MRVLYQNTVGPGAEIYNKLWKAAFHTAFSDRLYRIAIVKARRRTVNANQQVAALEFVLFTQNQIAENRLKIAPLTLHATRVVRVIGPDERGSGILSASTNRNDSVDRQSVGKRNPFRFNKQKRLGRPLSNRGQTQFRPALQNFANSGSSMLRFAVRKLTPTSVTGRLSPL